MAGGISQLGFPLSSQGPNTSLIRRAVAGKDLADFSDKYYQNLCQNHLDGPVTCHVLVQNPRFLKNKICLKSAKFSPPVPNVSNVADQRSVYLSGESLNGFGCGPWSPRRSATLSSKVNLPHAINLRGKCGANLITLR